MKPTRKDVARKAGVSTATVSYVLNNSKKLSNTTVKKVLDAVKELDYKPDMIARTMVTNETKQISIILDNITNPFYGEIILGFESSAIENGYFVNICTGYKNVDDYIDNFISRRIDGIFIVAMPHKFHMDKIYELVDKGIKVVISGNLDADIRKVSIIENDYVDAMDKAVTYLTDLGHKDIAYISGLERSLTCDKRIEGYLKAIEKYHLPYGESLLIEDNTKNSTTIQDGYICTRKLINSSKKFTAIICNNDLMAIGSIKALKEAGLNVPEDVSVVGFDGIQFGDIWEPALTTMSVPKTFLGQKAFELLFTNIKKGNTGFYINKLELIQRGSAGIVKK